MTLGLLLGRDLGEIVRHGVLDGVRALAHAAGGDQPLPLAPLPRPVLRLPIVEHLHAVGIDRVVRGSDRRRVVRLCAAIVARDPGARDGAAVVAEAETLGDLGEVGLAPDGKPGARGTGFERGIAGAAGHVWRSGFSNFSPTDGRKTCRTLANASELSN